MALTRKKLKSWTLSEYNEGTKDQLEYYINESKCNEGDKAYLYSHETGKLSELRIVKIISRMDDIRFYDKLLETDVLLDGEVKYCADTSAEFITDIDCYLVWFKFI